MRLCFHSYGGDSFRVFLLLIASFAGSALAQNYAGSNFIQDYSQMGISDVAAAAESMLNDENYAGAIPALEEVVERTKGLTDPQGLETLQNFRFQLAYAFYQIDEIGFGLAVFADYLDAEPRKKEPMALRMVAQELFKTGEWDKLEEVLNRLLNLPEIEPEDVLTANLLLGQTLFHQKKWGECIGPLTYAANNSEEERSKSIAQIMALRALVETKNWSELFNRLPILYRTDAKYDITLNLALMKSAKARFNVAKQINDREGLINTLLLYRMVLPREDLINFSNKRVSELSKKLADDLKFQRIKEGDQVVQQAEIDRIKGLVVSLKDIPPYEDEATFRIGQIYAEVKRYWESYVLLDELYKKDKRSEIGEFAMFQSVQVLYSLNENDRAEERIIQYLDERPDGKYARMLLSIMIRANLTKQNWDRVVELRKYIDGLPPTTVESDVLIDSDIHYMLAFGYLQKKEYALSIEQFDIITKNYPLFSSLSEVVYYRGMSFMLLSDYQNAINNFLLYQSEFAYGVHYSASIFRQGYCQFGLEKFKEAEETLTKFIETHPEDALISEAHSMRGDIESDKVGAVDNPDTPDVNEYDPHCLDRAIADYRKAIDKAPGALQATYAVSRAAEVYKLEFKWQEISDLMNYYRELLKDEADIALSIFWIGQSQIELGQVDKAIAAYLDAIESYGNEVMQEGVDSIIFELVAIVGQNFSAEERADFLVKLNLKLTALEEGHDVLKLRLRVALAMIGGEESKVALGAELIESGQDLALTSPLSLSVMCDAAVVLGNAEQMNNLYDYFLATFEGSADLWNAYRAKTFELLAKGDSQAVLDIIDEVQEIFGLDVFMGWAQIIRADTLYKMKDYVAAEKAYNTIMGISGWRGPLHAEAMYGMGLCRMDIDDFPTAHSFFQRTYLMFKGYDDGKWAAMGYLAAANSQLKQGREAAAISTWEAMLEDVYVNTRPEAEEAKKWLKKYGGAQ